MFRHSSSWQLRGLFSGPSAFQPERIEFGYLLATAINARSATLLKRGQIEQAAADCDRAVAILAEARRQLPGHPIILACSASAVMQRAEIELARGEWQQALASMDEGLALGANRNDVSYQAFESYWHIARKVGEDPTMESAERASTREEIVLLALDQLKAALRQGYGDLQRLETLPDYAGLRSDSRFQELVMGLRSASK